MEKPFVSVVMPTYNGADFIHEAIQSVLDQSYPYFELIIVDDGSTDGTSKIVNSFTDSRIIFLSKDKNSGIADSLNLGISKSKGHYFARMDDDDECHKDRLLRQVEYLESHPDVVVCATNDQNQGGQNLCLGDLDIRIGLLFRNVLIHASVMIPMAVVKAHQYNVNTVPSEDYDLWSRLLDDGKFHKLSESLMVIRYAADGQTATRRSEQLKLNIEISQRFFHYYGFDMDDKDKYFHKLFVEHNYLISGGKLIGVFKWLDKLGQANKALGIFPEQRFLNEIEFQKLNFINKYFINRKLANKFSPFFKLPFKYKLFVIKLYFKKYIWLD
jgi:glycosyltransferase involved in cell wall biosynthesis